MSGKRVWIVALRGMDERLSTWHCTELSIWDGEVSRQSTVLLIKDQIVLLKRTRTPYWTTFIFRKRASN